QETEDRCGRDRGERQAVAEAGREPDGLLRQAANFFSRRPQHAPEPNAEQLTGPNPAAPHEWTTERRLDELGRAGGALILSISGRIRSPGVEPGPSPSAAALMRLARCTAVRSRVARAGESAARPPRPSAIRRAGAKRRVSSLARL